MTDNRPPDVKNETTNGFSIAAMVLGIVWIYWIGSILAVIFGHISLSQIKRDGSGGKGMAIAGIVLGYVGIGILVTLIVLTIIAGITGSAAVVNDNGNYSDCILNNPDNWIEVC